MFQFNFSGVTFTASIAAGVGGWIPLGCTVIGADDVEINAAVVYVNGLGGGKIIIRVGLYTLTATINLLFSTGLYGFGENTHITSAGDFHLITISAQDDCMVENLQLSGTSVANDVDCIFIEDGSDRFYVSRVYITNSDRDGVHVEGTSIDTAWVVDCYITTCDRDAVQVAMAGAETFTNFHLKDNHLMNSRFGYNGNASITVISGNTSTGHATCGIESEGTMVDIVNNICYLNLFEGIYTIDTGVNVVGNICFDNVHAGIMVSTSGVDNYVNVSGNFTFSNDESGIEVAGVMNYNLTGNFVLDNAEHGIYLISTPWYGSVDDNYIMGNGTSVGDWHGIHVDGSMESKFTGNYIAGNDLDGIFFMGNSDNNLVDGNYSWGNGRYGVNISVATCNDNRVLNNYLLGNATDCINDQGTDTVLHEKFFKVANPNSNIGRHPAVILTDGVTIMVRDQINFPVGLQQLVRAHAVIEAAGTGDMRRGVETDFFKIGANENFDQHSDTIAAGEVAVAINKEESIDIMVALDGILTGDQVGIEFTRYGGHGNDTVGANCYFQGTRIQYV